MEKTHVKWEKWKLCSILVGMVVFIPALGLGWYRMQTPEIKPPTESKTFSSVSFDVVFKGNIVAKDVFVYIYNCENVNDLSLKLHWVDITSNKAFEAIPYVQGYYGMKAGMNTFKVTVEDPHGTDVTRESLVLYITLTIGTYKATYTSPMPERHSLEEIVETYNNCL